MNVENSDSAPYGFEKLSTTLSLAQEERVVSHMSVSRHKHLLTCFLSEVEVIE